MNGKEANARRVHSCYDKICADVTLIPEKMLFEHSHACYDTRLASGREGMEFEVGGDDGGGEFRVGCCSGAGAPYLGSNVVEFLAILREDECKLWPLSKPQGDERSQSKVHLVSHYRAHCSSCVCGDDDAAIKYTAYYGSTCTRSFG